MFNFFKPKTTEKQYRYRIVKRIYWSNINRGPRDYYIIQKFRLGFWKSGLCTYISFEEAEKSILDIEREEQFIPTSEVIKEYNG